MHAGAVEAGNSISLLERLISFDTTSRNSNLALIEFIRDYLADLGVDSELTFDDGRAKANLYATLGPADRAGVMLSGHTDVVPVDGQDWSTEPFTLTEKGGLLYGRGASDMKSFIAVCLAFAPQFVERELATPIHLAFSYDEEVGCIGVRRLLARLAEAQVRPRMCIVGEPTLMQVVRAHKGKHSVRCHVRGLASHSGLPHRGVNAVEAAAEVVAYLKSMARRFRRQGPWDEEYDPPYTSVHTGVIKGGAILNIVPERCVFDFEFRNLPQQDRDALFDEVRAYARAKLLPEMRAVSADAGFEWRELTSLPGLETAEDEDVAVLAKALALSGDTGKVSFGTEAGLFRDAGIPAVVCGPGGIEQAHKPDEFISLEQIGLCEDFMRRLLDRVRAV